MDPAPWWENAHTPTLPPFQHREKEKFSQGLGVLCPAQA